MPLASKRVLQIILSECETRTERFPGYRSELVDTIAEIMKLEHEHRVRGINIKQKVSDKISALGTLIANTNPD